MSFFLKFAFDDTSLVTNSVYKAQGLLIRNELKWASDHSSSTHGFLFSLFSEHGHWNLKQETLRDMWAVWCWHGDGAAEMLEHWEDDSEDFYLSSISHIFHFICILWALTVMWGLPSLSHDLLVTVRYVFSLFYPQHYFFVVGGKDVVWVWICNVTCVTNS